MFAQHLKICIQDPIGEPSRPHSAILRKMVSSFLDLDLMTSISLSVRNLWANCLGVGTSFLPLSFNLTIICRAVNSSMSPMTFFDASNIVGFLFFIIFHFLCAGCNPSSQFQSRFCPFCFNHRSDTSFCTKYGFSRCGGH